MSKSTNMLRQRRRDNNVKPNRRLDRKSSRGMLYENEELRLKTININAEVERGQSDIKKLKRENDQLRREIWYLRDEYDKLDKLLREKENQDSSSSSCSSESDSCSSCSEESEAVETSQNIENVQKTNLKLLNKDFDHLSVVPEEPSTENSEKNSNRASLPENWSEGTEKDVIKPDQSYPVAQEKISPKHFFSPIRPKPLAPGEEYPNDEFLGNEMYQPQFVPVPPPPPPPQANFYHGLPLPSLHKTNPDVIVKTDNHNFNTLRSQSSFSNGGNLEELLNDIETISHDILKISNSQAQGLGAGGAQQQALSNGYAPQAFCGDFNENASDIVARIQNSSDGYVPTGRVDNYEMMDASQIPPDRPYRSELNVVLMPSPMHLIGVEKYKNIQKSCESLNARSLDNLSSVSHQSLKIVPEAGANVLVSPESYRPTPGATPEPFHTFVPVPPICPGAPEPNLQQHQNFLDEQTNPFYFGNVRQDNVDFFNARYVPENYPGHQEPETSWKTPEPPAKAPSSAQMYNSKTNLLDTGMSSDHISSENEENLKFKTSRKDKPETERPEKQEKVGNGSGSKKPDETKSPKLSIRRRVSIHFRGKKDKSGVKNKTPSDDKPKSPSQDKKHLFDLKFTSDGSKDKRGLTQKTPSVESKISAAAAEPKTPNSGESKTSTSGDKKTDSKNFESSSTSDQKNSVGRNYDSKTASADRRIRKSSSVSPERKHGHGKESKKTHKKHKKGERSRNRRSSLSAERYHRERSYSICTDRSNILDHRLGFYNGYDDFTTSDRERTNSLSSCDTIKGRNLNVTTIPPVGKIPWCGCWGNGCL